jgi:hypothetical protein
VPHPHARRRPQRRRIMRRVTTFSDIGSSRSPQGWTRATHGEVTAT